tara:strand:- start:109 stop:477 length:369 start_codon:yes stop_codon:yes gene_type:complete
MSNDFEVHSFGNLDISELEEAKEEFLSWCDEEIQAKTQEIDLYTLTKEEFIEKYEDDFNNGLSFTDRLHYAISEWKQPDPKFNPETGEYNWKQLLEDWHNGDKKMMCTVEDLRGYAEENDNE